MVALTFRIGPKFEDANRFVYRLGAQRLDEMLAAKVVRRKGRLLHTVLPVCPGVAMCLSHYLLCHYLG